MIDTISKKRGRPSLDTIPTIVHLATDQPARIDAVVGNRQRSRFIREAIESELQRRQVGAQPPPTDPPPKPARAPVPPKTSEAAKSPKEVDAQPPAQAQDSGARRAKGYDPVTGKAYY